MQPGNSGKDKQNGDGEKPRKDDSKPSIAKATGLFLITAAVTLVAGFALERSGDIISKKIGMDGILFGATVLAAATSLPELSTGLASMKMKKYEMAVSDIFGGNAFLPVLFILATLLTGKAVIPAAKNTDIYLTALTMILTSVYVWAIIFRPKRKILYMGVDSFIVLIVYAIGIAGLFSIAG